MTRLKKSYQNVTLSKIKSILFLLKEDYAFEAIFPL